MTEPVKEQKRPSFDKGRILRLMGMFRYGIILLGISFLLIRVLKNPKQLEDISVLGPYIIFVCAGILNTLYMLLMVLKKSLLPYRIFVIIQILFDAVFISGLVFCTGGVFSSITPFYFAIILTASITLSKRESILFASLSIIFFSTVHILYLFNWFQPLWQTAWEYYRWEEHIDVIVSKILFHSAAFYIVAFLSGTLAHMLRSVRILSSEILENISDGILVVDANNKISFHNPAFTDLFGFESSRLEGNPDVSEIFEDRKYKKINRIIRGDFSECGEFILENTDNNNVYLTIKAAKVTEKNKAEKGIILLFEDISDTKKMEKALLRMDRYRALAEMSAGIAHEIKNPLASIRGSTEELEKNTEFTKEENCLFEIIKEESDRLSDIISDFFNYLRESPPEKSEYDLKEIVEDTIEVARANQNFRDITFNLQVPEDITLNLDKDQWKQVFLNLFLNSKEAGTESITIKARRIKPETLTFARKFVSIEEISSGVEILVSDTGEGIAPENISNVFIPFYTSKDEGIGIGLSIVNRIVRSHGGIIEIRKSGSSGATFIMTIPVYKRTREEHGISG